VGVIGRNNPLTFKLFSSLSGELNFEISVSTSSPAEQDGEGRIQNFSAHFRGSYIYRSSLVNILDVRWTRPCDLDHTSITG